LSTPEDDTAATLEAAMAVLEPLAALLLSRGVRHARAEELLKAAFVRAGARAFAAAHKLPSVSTLSVTTGLRRREVQRLLEASPASSPPAKISLAAQVRARWTSDRLYLDAKGRPRRLPRSAAPGRPSFASLAAAISKDVHPRPLLDELLRIGAVEEDGEHVRLRVQRGHLNAPGRSWDELVAIGGANVADHLSAVLVNLLTPSRPLFEQALFADGLTRQSAQRAADLARQLWLSAAPELTPTLQRLVDADEQASDNGWRMRIGLFSYIAPADQPDAPVRLRAARGAEPKAGAKFKPESRAESTTAATAPRKPRKPRKPRREAKE
jgi:Family of unknown function (DUF6502)